MPRGDGRGDSRPRGRAKPTKINGVIAGRSGANMMIRTATGTTTVTLNDSTKVERRRRAQADIPAWP
jgi:hypothetical protein